MTNFIKHQPRLLALLVFWLLSMNLAAQQMPSAIEDAEGTRHAARLRAAFAAAAGNTEDPAFLALFDQNPNLSRRAFLPLLASWEKETEPAKVEMAANLYSEIAGLAAERFGDYIPNLIIESINAQRPDVDGLSRRYTDFLVGVDSKSNLPADRLKAYGPYDDTYAQIDTSADYPEETFAIHRLYRAKMLRFQIALLLENYRLVWAERETIPMVLEPVKTLDTVDGLVNDYDDTQATGYRFNNIRINLDLGLLEYASSKIGKADSRSAIFYPRWAMVYLNGARIAYEQARLPALKDMIARARQEMAKDPALSKRQHVMRYVLATSQYMQRRLEGFNPNAEEVEGAFRDAWANLAQYEPMVSAGSDGCWVEGRHATRFWIQELSRVAGGDRICRDIIGKDWQSWWNLTLDKQRAISEPEDLLLRYQYLTAFYILGPNYFDQLTYRWMKFPSASPDSGEVDWAIDSLRRLPESIQWVADRESGEGFPPYDLAAFGLLPELNSRCKLVAARASKGPTDDRLLLLSQAVDAATAVHQPSSRGELLIAIGLEYKALGFGTYALECWKEVDVESDDIPLANAGFLANFLLAREYFELGDFERALHHAEKATKKLEAISPLIGIRSPEAQEWSRELADITALAVKTHIARNDPAQALAALTRGQQLQSAALEVEGTPGVKTEADDVRHQQQEVSAVSEQVAKLEAQPASAERDELLAESRKLLADSRAEYLLKSRELRQKYTGLYSRALKFDPLDLPGLQRALPDDVAVLQYFPTEDTLYTFLVTRQSFRLRSVAIADKDLDKLIVGFLRGVRRNVGGDEKVALDARRLYDALIAPSVEDLQGKSSLVLIPTGKLHGLPFACLTDDQGKPMVERWRLVELAKSTDLERMSAGAETPVDSVVAFANATGDLPAARAEGEKIVSMFAKGKLFESKEATKANLLSFGSGARVLHLATHGEWNLDDSLQNYLSMAGSEKIAQEEIFQLALDDTSLVILSACNTAMGEGGEGGYVASLAEAFWLAGSHSVVASLWAVDDSSTALLMETFYQRLKAGDDKAEALRAAQLKVRSEKRFEHPYYWAGFVLFGERR